MDFPYWSTIFVPFLHEFIAKKYKYLSKHCTETTPKHHGYFFWVQKLVLAVYSQEKYENCWELLVMISHPDEILAKNELTYFYCRKFFYAWKQN